ncbi:MAG: hypothetical protein CL792_05245 [Chloroflexi bacterium]|nr:hypothetical protein [Chloroflexota bacterium]|tara:strand:- start:3491 stop:4306 length:816 start_codon:yes stop_codon:yes gene_type:complete
MISLKRNNKGDFVQASGLRTRKNTIYQANQAEIFRISRSKFNDFLNCPKCFYLDRVKGLKAPDMPGWTLNSTVDELLKKEFDKSRAEQKPHRILQRYGLEHIIPYQHPELDIWRDSFKGIECQIFDTNLYLFGGIDDIWLNTVTNELIVLDYKSQADKYPVTTERYLNGIYHQGYKIQLEIYAYILKKMGFAVSNIGYFYVCNASKSMDGFHGSLLFEETLVPYKIQLDWIEGKLEEMLQTLNSENIPKSHFACQNCAFNQEQMRIEQEYQ